MDKENRFEIDSANQACSNCGKCKAACPAGIDIPAIIGAYGQHKNNSWVVTETLPEFAGPEDCIECGACTACCPERIAVKDLVRELAMQQCRHKKRIIPFVASGGSGSGKGLLNE